MNATFSTIALTFCYHARIASSLRCTQPLRRGKRQSGPAIYFFWPYFWLGLCAQCLLLVFSPNEEEKTVTKSEMLRVQKYLNDLFGTEHIRLKATKQKDEAVEVLVNDEFVGVIYRDAEDGEVSYDFNMAILESDLPVVAPVPSE
jgi:hypothetical protein